MPKGHRLTRETIDYLIRRYLRGARPHGIAASLGIHFGTVYDVLKREGVELDGRCRVPYTLKKVVLDVDPRWAAEFRGFFYADGSAGLWQESRKTSAGNLYYVYRPTLEIHLRADDVALVEEFQSVLGGCASHVKAYKKSHPAVRWAAQGWPRVYAVLDRVLLDGLLPAKKREDLDILYEAVLARRGMPLLLGPENRAILKDFHDRLCAVKRYKSSGG